MTKRLSTLLLALGLVLASASAAFGIGSTVGDGDLEKSAVVVVKQARGEYSAWGTMNYWVEPGHRKVLFTIDVKDKSVTEVDYFGSYFCVVDDGEDTVNKAFSDEAISVAGKDKADVKVKLPRNHQGCNLAITGSVLRPGQGETQKEIVVKKMVLTATTE